MKPLSLWRRKPKVVKDLQIDEVSSVSAGANPLAKVVLLKRDADRAALKTRLDEATGRLALSTKSIINDDSVDQNRMLARSFAQYLHHIGRLTKTRIPLEAVVDLQRIFGIAKNDWDFSVDADAPIGGGRRRRRPADDDDAARLDAQMDSDADRDDREDENDDATDDERVEKGMRTMESAHLKALFKRHGFETIAKCNIEKPFLTEFEMTEVGKQEAAERGISFAQLYESSITLRKAVEATKYAAFTKAGVSLAPILPTQTNTLAEANDVSSEDGGEAYRQLVRMAEKLRASSSTPMSLAQAFSQVYQDPENAAKARRERESARSRLPTTGARIAG